ncbi:MAG: SGNH/GDSL hydrolase family protein [Polyangiaceae bacterium]|nr:SGNH/GDSL hydrolase family protein [Polyangiaceae bacterium]
MELDVLPLSTRLAAWVLPAGLVVACAAAAPPTDPPEARDPDGLDGHAIVPAAGPSAPPVDAGVEAASDAAPGELDSAAAQAATLPRGTTVLHIGDSMAGALGVELNAVLKERGVRGILRFQNASFIPGWAWSKELPVYLAHHNPDLVLITLGTNEIQVQKPESRAGLVKKLVARLGDRPCVWILPPLWGPGDTGLLPVIANNAAPCRVLDSNRLFPDMPRLSDKIHPTLAARRQWAELTVDWLAQQRDPAGPRPWQLR